MPQSPGTTHSPSRHDVHLCADIGGTHARLALAEVGPGSRVSILAVERYLASETGSLAATLERFAAQFPEPWARGVRSACLGVAGPVSGGRVHMTNLGWAIDEHEVSQLLGGVPALFAVLQLPIDIRHVTVSASSFALAVSHGAADTALLWNAGLGVLAIACVNVSASFALALQVALSVNAGRVHSSARALVKVAIRRWLHGARWPKRPSLRPPQPLAANPRRA